MVSFHSESHIFFMKRMRHKFFKRSYEEQQTLIGYRETFLFRFLFYLELMNNYCAVSLIIYNIQDQRRKRPFELLLIC